MAHGDTVERGEGGAGLLLWSVGRAATRHLRDALAGVGLTPRQFLALSVLAERGATSQGALGEAMEIDPSMLCALLNPLEETGLASRRRDPADRRRHIVEISASGERRLAQALDAQRAVEDRLLAPLGADQRRHLEEALAALDVAGERSPRGPGTLRGG